MITLSLIILLCLAALAGAQPRSSGAITAAEQADLAGKRATLNRIHAKKCLGARSYRWKPWQVPRRLFAYVNTVQTPRWILTARKRPSLCVPFRALWECIHDGEGAWNDPNPPYFGGLQMGYWFMRTYGDRQTFGRAIYRQEGTADNWTPIEQMRVAAAAFREEGYSLAWLRGQWPRSHRPCVAGGVL